MAWLILSLTASLAMWSLYEMPSSFLRNLISVACNFFRMSAVNVQVSQAYNRNQGILDWSLSLERWSSVSLVLLLSVQFWTVLKAWNLYLWRLSCQPRPVFHCWFWCQCWYHSRIGHQFGLLCTNFHAKGCRELIQAIHQGGWLLLVGINKLGRKITKQRFQLGLTNLKKIRPQAGNSGSGSHPIDRRIDSLFFLYRNVAPCQTLCYVSQDFWRRNQVSAIA